MMQDFCTEEMLLRSLGLKRVQLDRLRLEMGFPFIKMTQTQRFYYMPDVAEWLLSKRIVLDAWKHRSHVATGGDK